MEEKTRPVVVRTIIHLTDVKGWKVEEERPGDFQCGNTYRMRKRARYRDATLPIGKFEQPDYPRVDGMICTDYEFELEMEHYEPLYENYFFKHLYFEEK